jgi:hypothetical protein
MTENKYPISINDIPCIGPCYPAGKHIIHPLDFTYITGDHNFCPTNKYEEIGKNGQTTIKKLAKCHPKDVKHEQEMDSNDILTPYILFNPILFLKGFYNLNSLEDILEWLKKNSHLPANTKLRVIECMFLSFDDIYIIDNIIIDCYKQYFIENIMIFYDTLYKYVYVDDANNKIYLKKNDSDKNKFNIERINFLTDKFINTDEINKFITKFYAKSNDIESNKLENYFTKKNIINNFIVYIENKIEKSL